MDTVAIVGLGYVGLPLAVEFGKKNQTIGFDLSVKKIESYKQYIDPTGEISPEALRQATHLIVTTNAAELSQADYIIVAVPTPVDLAHQPDFTPLISASEIVGRNMKQGAIIIYESTVYPGVTEEICIPVLEKHAGMRWQKDFYVASLDFRLWTLDIRHWTLDNRHSTFDFRLSQLSFIHSFMIPHRPFSSSG